MLRKLLVRLREALESGMRQQITPTGFVFSLFIVLIGIAAFASANNLLFLILAALLATLLISGFVSRLGLAGLELDLSLPEHIAARKPVVVEFIVRNRKWWTPSFSISLSGASKSLLPAPIYIPVLRSRSELREPVKLAFDRRGIYRENIFQFSSRFPFDFTQRRAQVRLDHAVLVYPCIDPQPGFEALLAEISGEMEAKARGQGLDFYRIRPYEHTESARFVDWKATAHTGQLQVREFAREQDPAVTIFLDLDVPATAALWFEAAVDYSAFLVWRLADRQTRVRFLSQRFDKTVPEEGDVYTVLRYLASVVPEHSPGVPSPHADSSIRIALSPQPERLHSTVWADARYVGHEHLAPALREASDAGSEPNAAKLVK
jgi:uncharacterized protein (DUF58 family)